MRNSGKSFGFLGEQGVSTSKETGAISRGDGWKLKRALFILLIICLFRSAAFGQPWDGNGVEGDPYLIYTPAQMNTIGAMLLDYDKHFRLMTNIDLSGYTGTSFFIIGSSSFPFTGVFDGNGHTISNFSYTSTATDYIGIFGYVTGEIKDLGLIAPDIDAGTGAEVGSLVGQGGSISNCYVDGGSVSGGYSVGGLVGRGGTITNCHSSGIVSGVGTVGGLVGRGDLIRDCWSAGSVSGTYWSVGGLVGVAGTVRNCYSTASVSASGSNEVGGLAGGGQIFNSYATGNVSGGDYAVGGLVGETWFGEVVVNCYSTGSVSGTAEVGGLVGYNNGMISACFWDVQTSGRINMCGSGSGSGCDDGNGKTTAEMQDINTFLSAGWDFVNQADGPSDDWAEPPGGGYMILWWQLPEGQLPSLPTFSGGTGEPNDPYLISTASELNRIGHNPRLMEAHFKLVNDIDLAGVDFFFIGNQGYDYSGIFDGNGHRISNFTYSSAGASYIGLFGAIRGANAGVKDLGLIDPDIDAGAGGSIGSLVGWFADGTINGCYVDGGSVSGNDYVGGLVGRNNYGTITDCYASGIVSGNENVGGLVGDNGWGGTITNSYATGSVSGDLFAVGGLVGSSIDIITDCYSSCDVSGGFGATGGLVGHNEWGTVTNSYATGSVSGNGDTGGLVGFNSGTVTNSYATGSVSGNGEFFLAGGLIGSNGGTIANCYSAGSVSGIEDVGGLVGWNWSGTISASFWDIQTSGRSNMCGSQESGASGCDDGNGKTTAQMQDPNTFLLAGWDFFGESTNGIEDIWRLCSAGTNYPRLAWQFPLSDFICPDGVDWSDLGLLCEQWLFEELSADVAPNGGDGIVNFFDWAIFANQWQITVDFDDLADFAGQWLGRVLSADVWPDDGDLFVDFSDWAVFADAWQSTPASPNWNRRCDIAPAGGDEIVDMDDIFVFTEEWLRAGSYYRHLDADIAPDRRDGIVNMFDFAALANNWLAGP